MDVRRNLQKELDALLSALGGTRPTLLLHSCCGPCSSYVLDWLWDQFAVTVLYYNPNIAPEAEYERRKAEQLRLIAAYRALGRDIAVMDCDYDAAAFACRAKGLEAAPEGGARCRECFRLRLEETAKRAGEGGFAYFGTTLTVSPHKDAAAINHIGEEIAGQAENRPGPAWLPSDFKKRDGYRRSVQLAREYGLYRQDYCGCVFSART